MKAKITGINRTLFELETGILLFGLVCQLVVLLLRDVAACSIGLWIGVITAALGAFHMWWSLDRALDLAERGAVKQMTLHNLLRYLAYVLVVALTAISGIANPIAVFVGLMGLKVSAYLHFLTKKISTAVYGGEMVSLPVEEPLPEGALTEKALTEESAKMQDI